MATYPVKGGKEFTKVAAGTHLAVCTLVADVGMQPGSGQFPDPKVRIYFRFEIPSERISYEKDGVEKEGPAIIYHNYTASMNAKANMRKGIESWRGAKFTDQEAEMFDVRALLAQTALVQIVHTPDGQYANVANIMAPPRGTPKLKPEGTCIYYGSDDDKAYDQLPKFLRDKVDNQLDPAAAAKPLPPVNQRTPKTGNMLGASPAEIAQAEREASRQAASDNFADDELPEQF